MIIMDGEDLSNPKISEICGLLKWATADKFPIQEDAALFQNQQARNLKPPTERPRL